MPRYRLLLEYDGGSFAGWQRQENAPSVQGAVEAAVLAFSGERVHVQGAGRTDAGVHAAGQVAHFDLERAFPIERVLGALNAHLRPAPIAVLSATEVEPAFHARFSATGRRYRYRICDRRAPPALEAGRVWWVPVPLDLTAMSIAAAPLIGRHDFSSFRATECQAKSPVKTLDELTVHRALSPFGLPEVQVEAAARSFLHHQVRNLVGSLVQVGRGTWPPDRIAEALAARDRSAAGPTAPPEGLCLVSVSYDVEIPQETDDTGDA